MSGKKEAQFRQLMEDFARQQGEQLLELEKTLPSLPEAERRQLLAAAQAPKQAREKIPARPSAPPWRRYAAAAALALLAGSTALLGEAGAVQDAMRHIQIHLTDDGVYFGLPVEEWEESWEMEGRYAPTWLPEGYEPIEQSKNKIEGYDSLAYGQTNHYKLGVILFQRHSVYAFVQGTEEKESAKLVWVGDNEGGLISREWQNSTDYRLTWYDPEAKSFFCLTTDRVTQEELFAIAESVQRID